MMRVPQPIPYQGSKRRIAQLIISLLPPDTATLIEPFAGSAAVSLAAAACDRATKYHLNDLNPQLMALWQEIIERPDSLAEGYKKLWYEQIGREREFYYFIRDEFNKTGDPAKFLYLLARCVKAAVRYNSKGKFNQSADNRRRGRHPDRMAADIQLASRLLRNKVILTSMDYSEILQVADESDVLYLDPPYQGVSDGDDPRYYSGIDFDEFVAQLEALLSRSAAFILSYDGYRGERLYGRPLPFGGELHKVSISTGCSAQSTLLGKYEITHESLYISEGLVSRLGIPTDKLKAMLSMQKQMQLPLPIKASTQ